MPEERASRFLVAFHLALQALKSHAIENAQVRRALDGLAKSANAILESENQLVARVAGELLYVNSAPVHLDVENFASLGHVLSTLQIAGVGIIRLQEPANSQEWKMLISQILKCSAKEGGPEGFLEMRRRLGDLGLNRILVEPPVDKDAAFADAPQRRESAKRTYQRSVSVAKDLFNSARMGRSGQVKEVKHAL